MDAGGDVAAEGLVKAKKQSWSSADKPATKKQPKSQSKFQPRKYSATPAGGTDSTTVKRTKSVLAGMNAGQND